MPKHWAVECKSHQYESVDYIEGGKADTEEKAIEVWRHVRGLYFIDGVTARRTTEDEDLRLEHHTS